jgi:hypothetical protein
MKGIGGSAFPYAGETAPNGEYIYGETGMTLRDYFAAKAMQSMLTEYSRTNGGIGAAHIGRNVSHHAYVMADAMLEARK